MEAYSVRKEMSAKEDGNTEIVGIILAESLDEAEIIAKEKLGLQTVGNMARDWLEDNQGRIHQIRSIRWINYPPSESQQVRLTQIECANELAASQKEVAEKNRIIADIRRLVGTST